MNRYTLVLAAVSLLAPVGSAQPVAPKTVTLSAPTGQLGAVLNDVARQTGITVTAPALDAHTPCPVSFDKTPFWIALEQIAAKVSARIALAERGRQITLVRRTGPAAPSSVDGPFRVVVKQVVGRLDFETGKAFTEVTLDVHWEPRFPVFRITSEPTITEATADADSKLTAITAHAKTPPRGYLYTTTVRLTGVPRTATKLTRLAGTFTVTASPTMLSFLFDLAGKPPLSQTKEKVTTTLKRFEKVDNRWEAELELTYPPNGPRFESFESWVTENRARLIAPNKSRSFAPTDSDIPEQGQKVVAVYRFTGLNLTNRAGWALLYETPAPLVEYPIHFELKDIPLPP
jgi:hypothetical protein